MNYFALTFNYIMTKQLLIFCACCLAGTSFGQGFSVSASFGLATDYNAQQLMAEEGMKVSNILPMVYSGSIRYERKRFLFALERCNYRSEYRAYNATNAGGIANSAFTGLSIAYNFLPLGSLAKVRGGLGIGVLSYSKGYRTIEPYATIGLDAYVEIERTLARYDGGVLAITPRLELEVPITGRLSATTNVQMLLPLWANASVSKEVSTFYSNGGRTTYGNGGGKAIADIRLSFAAGLNFRLSK